MPAGKRTPVDIPETLISSSNLEQSSLALQDFITVNTQGQFKVSFFNKNDKGTYFSIQGMLYDDYLNWISARVYS